MANQSDKKSSIFGAAIMAAPAAIGLGMATRGIIGGWAGISAAANPPVIGSQIQNTIRSFAEQYTGGLARGARGARRASILKDLATSTQLSASQIRNVAYRVAQSVDPTGGFTGIINQRLAAASTAEEALNTLEMVLNENSSIYTQRAMDQLVGDLQTLSAHVAKGGELEPVSLLGQIPRFNQVLKPSEYAPWMREEVERIQTLTGADVGLRYQSRADVEGRQLVLSAKGGQLPGEVELRIPGVLRGKYEIAEGPLAGMGGVVSRGGTQQSQYITGLYGMVEGGKLTGIYEHEHWVLHRAAAELFPQLMNSQRINQRQLNRTIHEFENRMIQTGDYMYSVPSSLHAGPEAYAAARSQAIHLYEAREGRAGEKFMPLGIQDYAEKIMSGGLTLPTGEQVGLWPGAGPSQINAAVAALSDPAAGMTTSPYAFAHQRRALQPIRQQYAPTASAVAAMEANPVNRRYAWMMRERTTLAPVEKIAYISSSRDALLQGTGWSSEGMSLATTRRNAERQAERVEQYLISSQDILGLRNYIDIKQGSRWTINKTLEEDIVLGRDPSGKLITAPRGARLLEATAFEQDMARGDFIKVLAATTEPTEFGKVFGATKATTGEITDLFLQQNILSKIGYTGVPEAGATPIDRLVALDELRKNRALHYDQMFSSLWEFSRINMNSGKTMSGLASNFASDPYKALSSLTNRVARVAEAGAKNYDELMMRALGKVARGAQLTPWQMGRVFGAVPEVYGTAEAMLPGLSPEELAEINLRLPIGFGQVHFAGAGAETGAGAVATLEPRAFELLGSPHWGPLGKRIQEDIAQRMMAAYPERLFEQAELGRSLESILNLRSRAGAISATELLGGMGKGLTPSANALLQTGIGDIYIPGAATMKQLAGYQAESGMLVNSPLANAYRDVIEASGAYGAKNLTREGLQGKLDILAREVHGARLGTVMAKGGLLRGRIPGSMALRAVIAPAGIAEALPTGVKGLTYSAGEQMFRGMRELGIYQEEEIARMEEAFARRELIPGLEQRHPHIGPYSTQATFYKLVEGDRPVMYYNEERANAIIAPRVLAGEELTRFRDLTTEYYVRNAAGAKEALAGMGAEVAGTPLRLSSLVGQAGDFDADNISALFAGPQIAADLQQHITDPATGEAYRKYAIRRQLLKAKAPADVAGLSLRELLGGSAYMLSTTASERLGGLSNLMQEYRAAALLGAGNITPGQAGNVLAMFDWLEQEPISGKHIPPGREEQVIGMFNDMREALAQRSEADLTRVAIQQMEMAKASGRAALHEGFTIALQEGERLTTQTIEGLNINETVRNAMAAREAMESTIEGKQTSARVRQLLMEKGPRAKAEEILGLMSEETLARSPFGSFFQPIEQRVSTFANVSKRMMTLQNRLAAAGKGMLAHSKPLAIGLGVSMGLAALLSEPPQVLPLGAKVAPQPNLRSGSGGSNIEGVNQDSRVEAAPTASDLTRSQNTARVSADEGFHINIRANASQKTNLNALNNQMRQAAGGRARVHSTIQDRRGSLTPQKLSSMLTGR